MRGFKVQRCLAAASVLAVALAQTKLKIMPLGDSITEITCWRPIVWDNLQDAGVTDQIEFVGSQTGNPENCTGNAGWDMHHEGHAGYRATDIANNNLVGWLAAAKPDIVMFHLGTNDFFTQASNSTSAILAAYTKMVEEMRASNPNMRVIVDLIIPLGFWPPVVPDLNNAIPAWAAGLSTTNSPITIADCFTGFPTSGLRDSVHPNAAGDAIIASRIYPVLLNTIKLALGGTGAVPLYGQCGGDGWTGPTTCATGTCQFGNIWYSQCRP